MEWIKWVRGLGDVERRVDGQACERETEGRGGLGGYRGNVEFMRETRMRHKAELNASEVQLENGGWVRVLKARAACDDRCAQHASKGAREITEADKKAGCSTLAAAETQQQRSELQRASSQGQRAQQQRDSREAKGREEMAAHRTAASGAGAHAERRETADRGRRIDGDEAAKGAKRWGSATEQGKN